MHFYTATGIILYTLLQSTEISSTQELRLENDVTRYIDRWVNSILSMTGSKALEIIRSSCRDGIGFLSEYNITNKQNHSHTRAFIFSSIYLVIRNKNKLELPKIQWTFPENKLKLCFKNLPITISSSVTSHEDPKFHNNYKCDGYLDNLTLIYHGSHCDTSDPTRDSPLDTKYNHFHVGNVSESHPNENLTIKEIEPVFLVMIEHFISKWIFIRFDVYEFQRAFDEPTKEIISIHPDFLSNPQKYYYFIPKIPYFCFTLKHIVIRGLSNFEYCLDKFWTSLLIRNIRGSMILDYGFEEEPHLELSFLIDTIRVLKGGYDADCNDLVHIEAQNYIVTRMESNVQLSDRQSELIVDRLGSAFASGLSSLMEEAIVYDSKAPLRKIETNGSDWKTIKESYKGRIPFSDD